MAHYELATPVGDETIRRLRVNDTVTLQNRLFGIRDATQIALFDRGRTTRFDLRGHAVIHTAPNVRKVDVSADNPTGYASVCIGTTTSMRMERFTEPLMRDLGGVYLAVVGGAAALQTTWIEAIEDVDFEELNPECLWKFSIRGFGPLLVTMDSHGGSLHRDINDAAASRRDEVLARIGALK